jgi:hypothetical protein
MDIIPGYIMGITRVTISYPFEMIKNNMQINKYDKTIDAIKNIYKKNPKYFYKGASLQYLIMPIDRSLQFYYCEKMKNKYNSYFIGATSGILSCVYNIPISYISSNVMTSHKNIKDIVYRTNIKNIYKGGSLESLRSIVAPSIYLGTYFYLRENYSNKYHFTYALYGCISSILCWFITYPIDTLRIEYQLSKKSNIKNLILNRYKKYGLKNYYKGFSLIIIRTFPSSFIGTYVYEKSRYFLKLN